MLRNRFEGASEAVNYTLPDVKRITARVRPNVAKAEQGEVEDILLY